LVGTGSGALRRALDWARHPERAGLRRICLFALILGLAAYGLKCAQGKDFYSYYDIGLNVRAGAHDLYVPGLYSGMQNHYPPVFALCMVPLTLLPLNVAGYLWFLAKAALLVTVFQGLPGLFGRRSVSLGPAVLWLAGLMIARFAIDDFKLGQINLLMMEAMVGVLLLKDRGRHGWAALVLALAISFKLFPAILLVHSLGRREFRFTALCALLCVGLNLIPFLVFGSGYPAVLGQFMGASVTGVVTSAQSGVANQSLYGMLMRLLGHNPTDAAPLAYAAVADLPFAAIRALDMGLCALLAVLVLAGAWKARGERELSSLSLAFLAALLIPMVTRKANFVLLLLPGAAALRTVLDPEERTPAWARALVWTTFVLASFTADGLITRSGSNILESCSDIALAALLLFVFHAFRAMGAWARTGAAGSRSPSGPPA
jgi:hypothetical protein